MDKHECPVCGKTCASAGGLSSHMRSHSEEEIAKAEKKDDVKVETVDEEKLDAEKEKLEEDNTGDPEEAKKEDEDNDDIEDEPDAEEEDNSGDPEEAKKEDEDDDKDEDDEEDITEDEAATKADVVPEDKRKYKVINVTAKNPFTYKHTVMVNGTKVKPGGKIVLDQNSYKEFKSIIAEKNRKLGPTDYLQII